MNAKGKFLFTFGAWYFAFDFIKSVLSNFCCVAGSCVFTGMNVIR